MMTRGRALGLGVMLAGLVFVVGRFSGLSAPAAWTAAITTLCACWWVLEPIPIPATSLLPFALFPLAGMSMLNIEPIWSGLLFGGAGFVLAGTLALMLTETGAKARSKS